MVISWSQQNLLLYLFIGLLPGAIAIDRGTLASIIIGVAWVIMVFIFINQRKK